MMNYSDVYESITCICMLYISILQVLYLQDLLQFNDFRNKRSNVSVVFHIFENQGCHAVHTHLLIWVKSLARVKLDRFKEHISKDHVLSSFTKMYFSTT